MPTLPNFKYHPDPLGTGSIEESDSECLCCEAARGYVYTGSVYSEEDLGEAVCPWCIANGAAAEKFDAAFSSGDFFGDTADLPQATQNEVTQRTPGFSSWQEERWWTHCGDAGAFLGPMGNAELSHFGDRAVEAIATESGYVGSDLSSYMASLNRDNGPTAYLFRCLHCGEFGGFSDCH